MDLKITQAGLSGMTIDLLTETAQSLRSVHNDVYDSSPINFVNSLKIPVMLVIRPADEFSMMDNCSGYVFQFTATHPLDESSKCVVTIGFETDDKESLKLHYTIGKTIFSQPAVVAIVDGIKKFIKFFS